MSLYVVFHLGLNCLSSTCLSVPIITMVDLQNKLFLHFSNNTSSLLFWYIFIGTIVVCVCVLNQLNKYEVVLLFCVIVFPQSIDGRFDI